MPQTDPLDELYTTLARCWPDYHARDEQRAMSEAVAHTVERGGTLLVEAGTGVGKSLAYLLPALLAVRQGQRVLIATSHKPLQDQLDSKDLPLVYDLARRLRWKRPRWVTLKGIANYLCLEAQDEQLKQEQLAGLGQLRGLDQPLRRFVAWQNDKKVQWDGDWESAPPFVSAEMRNELSSSSDDCLRERCPHFANCYALKKRRAAAAANIVITNHALLALDLHSGGFVLPGRFDLYIIDEGHLWEESVTRSLGAEIGRTAICRLLEGGLMDQLGSELRNHADVAFAELDAAVSSMLQGANGDAEGKALLTGSLAAGRKLAGMLAKMAAQICPPNAKWATFIASIILPGLSDTAVADTLADMFGQELDYVTEDGTGYNILDNDEAAALRAAKQLLSAAIRLSFICVMGRDDYVYYAERAEGGYVLNALPISIANEIASWWDQNTAVVTSATLSDGESFDFFAARLGIHRPHTLMVASPFDYKRRTRFLNWPVRGQEEAGKKYYDEIAERIALLSSYADGRVLALFTSHRAMRAVHTRLLVQRMRASGPLLLRQGEATQLQLVSRFQSADRALLLGTRSWWQGVDLPGLRMVIMDKLPFPQLGEPLVQARMAALEADGNSSFGSYMLPSALISFRQGLGRLMRREDDWGVVVSLDERIADKSYGPRFLNALPGGMRPVSDAATVIEWLRKRVR